MVIMGVSGSGKTTVGQALAQALGWRFDDADSFHPPANIAKMSAGVPLTDADREPWLQAIRRHVGRCLTAGENAVVTCSALKQSYRQIIIVDPLRVPLVYLRGSRALLQQRISHRQGHFMKSSMLDSQLADLEEPENALVIDVSPPPGVIVGEIRRALKL
jgi:gluconokinase